RRSGLARNYARRRNAMMRERAVTSVPAGALQVHRAVALERADKRVYMERFTGVSLRREAPDAEMAPKSRRSEHACNCVLNEAEAAPPRQGRHLSMDLSCLRDVGKSHRKPFGGQQEVDVDCDGLHWMEGACRVRAGWKQSES